MFNATLVWLLILAIFSFSVPEPLKLQHPTSRKQALKELLALADFLARVKPDREVPRDRVARMVKDVPVLTADDLEQLLLTETMKHDSDRDFVAAVFLYMTRLYLPPRDEDKRIELVRNFAILETAWEGKFDVWPWQLVKQDRQLANLKRVNLAVNGTDSASAIWHNFKRMGLKRWSKAARQTTEAEEWILIRSGLE